MVYFLIGGQYINDSKEQTWSQIKNKCLTNSLGSKSEGSPIDDLGIERFKLGNLDNLMIANDQMLKLENTMEALLKKIERQYLDLDVNQKNDLKIKTYDQDGITSEQYIWNFQWDDSKYPRNNQVTEVIKNLTNKMNLSDQAIRKDVNNLQELKSQAQSFNKKETNILNADLTDLLNDKVMEGVKYYDSRTIATLVCFVPVTSIEQWTIRSSFLSQNVIPNTNVQFERIQPRDGYTVWRINIFLLDLEYDYLSNIHPGDEKLDEVEQMNVKQSQDLLQKFREEIIKKFTKKAKDELKVVVKEFKYVPGQSNQKEIDRQNLENKIKIQTNKLREQCQTSFSELYQAYVHLKYLRFVVDIVMRFGKEQIFSCKIKPVQGKEKNIQQQLLSIFLKQGDRALYGTKEELEESEDFFPYAYVPINI